MALYIGTSEIALATKVLHGTVAIAAAAVIAATSVTDEENGRCSAAVVN